MLHAYMFKDWEKGRAVKDKAVDTLRIIFVATSTILSWLRAWHPYFSNDLPSLIAVIIGGYPIFREAYHALRSKSITMEVAMTIGIASSLLIGEYTTATVIVLFTLTSELIEEMTLEKGRKAIEALTKISPKKALVRRNGEEREVEIDELRVGDIVIVKPGEKIPVDGVVVAGEATVNQAPITGESMPVEKEVGSEVFAGVITQDGVLEVEAGRIGEDTTFGRIVRLVEEAEASKAPVQRFADRFASRFVPLALVAAFTVFLITGSSSSAIAVTVVACPCAIAVAVPLAVIASIGKAARKGIIVKGGVYLEELSRVDTVVLDKTGTLTLGSPRVVGVKGFRDHSEEEIVRLAAIVESHSEHPIARAVASKAKEYGLEVPAHEECQIISGKGVVCRYGDGTVLMGNRELLRGRGVEVPEVFEEYMRAREGRGETPMLIAHDDCACGVLSVADTLREDAVEGLNDLRILGVKRFIMMTGDNPRTAKLIADQVGIEEVMAEMLPEDKVAKVKELVKEGSKVLMVGDGVNDAPALAEANVGVAMGVVGSDIAMEAADVAVMTDNFRNVAEAVRIGRRALEVARQNIYGSLIFNMIGLSLASFGLLSPLMAAVAHVLPDVILFLNSSRIIVE